MSPSPSLVLVCYRSERAPLPNLPFPALVYISRGAFLVPWISRHQHSSSTVFLEPVQIIQGRIQVALLKVSEWQLHESIAVLLSVFPSAACGFSAFDWVLSPGYFQVLFVLTISISSVHGGKCCQHFLQKEKVLPATARRM